MKKSKHDSWQERKHCNGVRCSLAFSRVVARSRLQGVRVNRVSVRKNEAVHQSDPKSPSNPPPPPTVSTRPTLDDRINRGSSRKLITFGDVTNAKFTSCHGGRSNGEPLVTAMAVLQLWAVHWCRRRLGEWTWSAPWELCLACHT